MKTRIGLVVITAGIVAVVIPGRAIAQTDGLSTHHPKFAPLVIPGKAASQSGQRIEGQSEQTESNDWMRGHAGKFVSFDAPGAGTAANQGTQAVAINDLGTVTGYDLDASSTYHGFVRRFNGSISTFDVPGAGVGSYNGTNPAAINDFGAITGSYYDANGGGHGFVRIDDCRFDHFEDCTIISFDGPGAINTFPADINLEGAITGSYIDASFHFYGFLRSPDGTITTFALPGGGFTAPSGINFEGAIAGQYAFEFPGGQQFRGFLRSSNGAFVTFDAASYPPCCIFTYPVGINDRGMVAGYDNDGFNIYHGFLRTHNGAITTFDAPGAGTGNFQGTLSQGINLEGAIAGFDIDANLVRHGFWRTSYGAVTSFDAPGAGTAAFQGTHASAINLEDAITGYYTDANNVVHGFLRICD